MKKTASNDRYKWIALSNTTLGVLLATLDASITLRNRGKQEPGKLIGKREEPRYAR